MVHLSLHLECLITQTVNAKKVITQRKFIIESRLLSLDYSNAMYWSCFHSIDFKKTKNILIV